jgi:hypothetical protein
MIAAATPYTWDKGLRWRTEFVSLIDIQQPFYAVTVDFVTEKVLRALTDGHEDDLVQNYIEAATEMCEAYTDKSVRPQQRRQIMSGFPAGRVIQLQRGPVHSIRSVDYYDAANQPQNFGGILVPIPVGAPLPAPPPPIPPEPPPVPPYVFVPGSRPTLQLQVGASWPATAVREDAVVITYWAGYENAADIPMLIRTGIAHVVGELYKNPDLSNADDQVPNLLNLDYYWQRRW